MKLLIDISDEDIKWAYDYAKFPEIQNRINTVNLAEVIKNGILVEEVVEKARLFDEIKDAIVKGKGIKDIKRIIGE